mgnify:CR=1 FL=1
MRLPSSRRIALGCLWLRACGLGRFFFGDERCVDRDDPESNFRMARETLLEPAGVREERVHRILTEEGEVLRHLTLDPTKNYQAIGTSDVSTMS